MQMGITDIISLLSGVALFLFGMSLMSSGLKTVAGSKLELMLYRLTNSIPKGVALGTGVTAVIQSSAATSVMLVGFVNSNMMRLKQATAIITGAILGTSITGWIICLSDIGGNGADGWIKLVSTTTITGVVAICGIILRMFCKKASYRHVGDILMGFAVLMFGMQTMSASVAPLKESEAFMSVVTAFSNPALSIAVGILLAGVLQSSSASVGIVQALAVTGAIDFSVAFPLIMGIGIGSSVPVLVSAISANVNGKRTAFVYLVAHVIGAIFCGAIFYTVNAFYPFSFANAAMTSFSVALTNSLFRLATMILLIPLNGLLVKIVSVMIRDKSGEPDDNIDIDRLEERLIEHPAIAIEQSRIAMCSMAEKAEHNFARAVDLLKDYSNEKFQLVLDKEDVIDRYEDKLGSYLVKLTGKELSHDENKDVSEFLHTIGDFERIGDHAVNIAEAAQEIHDKKIVFSPDARKELDILIAAVSEIMTLSVKSFTDKDLEAASRVEPLEEVIDNICDIVKLHHVRRVQTGECTLNQGFVFNDMLTDFERTSDHCSNIAVAMIELEKDMFDTHEYLNTLVDAKAGAFSRYFEDYSKKY